MFHRKGGFHIKTKTISFELPLGVFSALRKTPEELKNDIRIVAAVKWYEMGQISQEEASEIAGLCREDFSMELARFNVSPFQYTADEVLKEAGLYPTKTCFKKIIIIL
jgi:predicted HTH domain antitoxin